MLGGGKQTATKVDQEVPQGKHGAALFCEGDQEFGGTIAP